MPAATASQPGAAGAQAHPSPRLGATTPPWLGPFFTLAAAFPLAAEALRPLVCAVAPYLAPGVRRATRRNAAHIFGCELGRREANRFTRGVVRSFYTVVVDTARASRMSAERMHAMIDDAQGVEAYAAVRAQGRGVILVTAHLGAFEAGLAALAREEKRVHVVFQRDPAQGFERIRARVHRTLGVVENPIDDGMTAWLALRDALLRDEAVVMQGDRAVPGQRSAPVPFLHATLRIPIGPVRLAQLTGAPIVPVFTIPTSRGRRRMILKAPIEADRTPLTPGAYDASALRALADAMASVVREHPHMWLALEPVFEEDRCAHAR